MIRTNKTFVLSDESLNSHGFSVLTKGIDFKDFLKNPIMLRNHEGTAIGVWENVRIDGNRLIAEPVFSESSELAKQTAEMVNEGILKGASIGISDCLFKENKELTDSLTMDLPVIVERCILYEASIVEFPSNKNAIVALYDTDKKIIVKDVKQLKKHVQIELLKLKNLETMDGKTLQLFDLPNNATQEQLHEKISSVLTDMQTIKSENIQLKHSRNEEFLQNALTQGKINFSQVESYRALLNRDFNNTKQIINSLPSNRIKISDLIKNAQLQTKADNNNNNAPKEKSLWTLKDYRKFAPLELQNNSELYHDLLEKEGIKK